MYSRLMRLYLGVFLCAAATTSIGQIHDPRALDIDPATATTAIAPRLSGLGATHFEVTTISADSQYFFDQGLRLTYAFNHSEALRAFKEAIRLDPANAMAYWGWALVLGPNLNLAMQSDVIPQAFNAIQKARALSDKIAPKERALIQALSERYGKDGSADRTELDRNYATAMSHVADLYPDDPDIQTLYAAALMNLSPWDYWYGDGSPKANTKVVLSALQAAMKSDSAHPGALHYYIHIVEAVHPELGGPAADKLGSLMPAAGHIVHMPSHIYMRLGRYLDSYNANVSAAKADQNYIDQCKAQGIYPLAYYPHNMHFIVWTSMLMGKKAEALKTSRMVAQHVPSDFSTDAWAIYQTFLAQPLYTMVRFGMWAEILEEKKPADNAMFHLAVWHYARGLAYVNRGDSGSAAIELGKLQEIEREPAAEEQAVGWNAMPTMLEIAENILRAEISAQSGEHDKAISQLERAVRLQDGLTYNEPPDWYFPVRHYLGAELLDAGYPKEAAVIYWDDLRKSPGNGYALFGLAQALKSQGLDGESAEITARFDEAWRYADIELVSSRY